MPFNVDVIVIGGGLSGLTAAWQLASHGKRVQLVTKGWGATHWLSGCIDVLGYSMTASEAPCQPPESDVARLIQANPQHPYALTGLTGLVESLTAWKRLCQDAGYPMHGSIETNWLLPSAVGAVRPTCLAPETMIAGDLRKKDPMLIIGFKRLNDFYPALVADNLTSQGVPAQGLMLDLEGLKQEKIVNPLTLARRFAQIDFIDEIVHVVKPELRDAERVGFPAVLGLRDSLKIKSELETRLELPVFEIPTLPPSIPGMRLHQLLIRAIRVESGRVFDGIEVLEADTDNQRVGTIYAESAARKRPYHAPLYILATGGILGGGITSGHQGPMRETIFNLPLSDASPRSQWFKQDYFDTDGHPAFQTGIPVDHQFRPLNPDGDVIFDNLMVIGTTLAHCEPVRERSFEGVALATAYAAARHVIEVQPDER